VAVRNYIGLATTGHDNALAIVGDDGEIRFAEATERHLQSKRALQCPADDLYRLTELIDAYCDPDATIVVAKSWSDEAPAIFASERTFTARRMRQIARVRGKVGISPDLARLLDCIGGAIDEYDFIVSLVADSVERAGRNVEYVCRTRTRARHQVTTRAYPHHLTHAAAGAYTSPFEHATCAVIDGFGEGCTSQFYRYAGGAFARVETPPIEAGEMGISLGLFYADLCRFCGFDQWKGEEWKVMGLASYGELDPELVALLHSYLRVDGLRVRHAERGLAALPQIAAFARRPGEPALRAANLARAAQEVFCELVRQLLCNLHEVAPSENLVLGGGCALNSSCNGTIVGRTPFSRLHVACAPADDGNALGAALLAHREDHPTYRPEARVCPPYLGSPISHRGLDQLCRYGGFARIEQRTDVHERAAELLAEGKILGWMQGRAELGPRALGNRSILADPRSTRMKDEINTRVKFREEFRPFAPSILHEFGHEYFTEYQESPYMERTLSFRPEVRARVPAVVHSDGTGRLQSVRREWNERYHALISAFHRNTGVPLLLNTSFNVMGKPIVHSVEDAIAVFCTSGLDVLVIDNVIIEKQVRESVR
jgi:carbamoyltransferase